MSIHFYNVKGITVFFSHLKWLVSVWCTHRHTRQSTVFQNCQLTRSKFWSSRNESFWNYKKLNKIQSGKLARKTISISNYRRLGLKDIETNSELLKTAHTFRNSMLFIIALINTNLWCYLQVGNWEKFR